MKPSSRHTLRRRDLVRLLGGAAFALPALELFGRDVRAQATPGTAKYAVFCYTPDGVNQRAFWPALTQTGFDLGSGPTSILSPFAPYHDKILVLGPEIDGSGTIKAGSGLAYMTSAEVPKPSQHQAAVTLAARTGHGCATDTTIANECIGGSHGLPYRTQAGVVNDIDGPSIDQVIGDAKPGNVFTSLNFGIHPVGGDTPSEINFDKNGKSLKRLASAGEAWNYVFKPPVSAQKQSAVTDFLDSRFGALDGIVSAHDRDVVDAHLTALRSYEAQVAKASQCDSPQRRPVPIDDDSVRSGADAKDLCPLYMDLISTAFACNMTHVASVTFGYPGGGDAGGLRMPWLGFEDPLHSVSHHGGDSGKLGKYAQMHNWIASQIAGLMDRLAQAKDSLGVPLLDQTVIYWFNRHGDGDSHSNFALPNVLLGGAGGYFRMGRSLQLPATNPTQVLISIANSMGVDVPTFGEAPYIATSPLSGLV